MGRNVSGCKCCSPAIRYIDFIGKRLSNLTALVTAPCTRQELHVFHVLHSSICFIPYTLAPT